MASISDLYNNLYPVKGTTQIRLLKILPGVKGTPLQTQLTVCDLRDGLKYEALSYVWGERSDQGVQVWMNNLEIKHVHENLRRFLSRIRNDSSTRTVWVDALCINQENMEEKALQIQMMGQIYRKAHTVLGWLGEHDEHSEQIFGMSVNDRLLSMGKRLGPLMLPATPIMLAGGIYSHVKMVTNKKPLEAWEAVLSRPYFNRTWIVQEMLLAKKIKFVCGEDTMDMRLFEKPLTHYMVTTKRKKLAEALPRSFLIFFAKRQSSRGWGKDKYYFEKRDIFELVHEFQHTQCSELLDRVYAMISLEAASKFPALLPNYNLNAHELFVQVCATKLPSTINDETCQKVAMLFKGLRFDRNDLDEEDDQIKNQNAEAIIACSQSQWQPQPQSKSSPQNIKLLTQSNMIRALDIYGLLQPNRTHLITSSNNPDQIQASYKTWKTNHRQVQSQTPNQDRRPTIFKTLDEPIWGRYNTFEKGRMAAAAAANSSTINQINQQNIMNQMVLQQNLINQMMVQQNMTMMSG